MFILSLGVFVDLCVIVHGEFILCNCVLDLCALFFKKNYFCNFFMNLQLLCRLDSRASMMNLAERMDQFVNDDDCVLES